MNSSFRYLLPAALFLAFAFAHSEATNSSLETLKVVKVREDVPRGTPLEQEMLAAEEIQIDLSNSSIVKSLFNYEYREVEVVGRTLTRDLSTGDLLTAADLLPAAGDLLELEDGEVGLQIVLDSVQFIPAYLQVGASVGFVVRARGNELARLSELTGVEEPDSSSAARDSEPVLIGPFRLLAIGRRSLPQLDAGADNGDQDNDTAILTIAASVTNSGGQAGSSADRRFSADVVRLLQAASGEGKELIVNIAVLQSDSAQNKKTASASESGK